MQNPVEHVTKTSIGLCENSFRISIIIKVRTSCDCFGDEMWPHIGDIVLDCTGRLLARTKLIPSVFVVFASSSGQDSSVNHESHLDTAFNRTVSCVVVELLRNGAFLTMPTDRLGPRCASP